MVNIHYNIMTIGPREENGNREITEGKRDGKDKSKELRKVVSQIGG